MDGWRFSVPAQNKTPNRKLGVLGTGRIKFLAEGVGFEPTIPCGITVFKTVAFVHSAIPPLLKHPHPAEDFYSDQFSGSESYHLSCEVWMSKNPLMLPHSGEFALTNSNIETTRPQQYWALKLSKMVRSIAGTTSVGKARTTAK